MGIVLIYQKAKLRLCNGNRPSFLEFGWKVLAHSTPIGQELLRDVISLHPLLKDDLKLPAAPGRDTMQAEVESPYEH